jgi:hypothetical protein
MRIFEQPKGKLQFNRPITRNTPKDLQWIKRKDGKPVVNVGDWIYSKDGNCQVLEVGVNSFVLSKDIVDFVDEMHTYIALGTNVDCEYWEIDRKYPLPDEEVEEKKIHFMESKGMEYIRNNNATLVCECGKEHEIVIDYKNGTDVEDLTIKKEE